MKTILGILFALTVSVSALDIVAGKATYTNCTNFRVVGMELVFTHDAGTARVQYDSLPQDLQKQYFNTEKIGALRTQQQNAAAASAALDQVKRERIANYRSGKWQRFQATMVGPAQGGQLMRKPDGTTIYVGGDLGLAQGESRRGYFERIGNFDYTAAGGGAARVQSYALRADAAQDMAEDLLLLLELKNRLLENKITQAEISTLADLQVRLGAEGESPILLK